MKFTFAEMRDFIREKEHREMLLRKRLLETSAANRAGVSSNSFFNGDFVVKAAE